VGLHGPFTAANAPPRSGRRVDADVDHLRREGAAGPSRPVGVDLAARRVRVALGVLGRGVVRHRRFLVAGVVRRLGDRRADVVVAFGRREGGDLHRSVVVRDQVAGRDERGRGEGGDNRNRGGRDGPRHGRRGNGVGRGERRRGHQTHEQSDQGHEAPAGTRRTHRPSLLSVALVPTQVSLWERKLVAWSKL